MRTSRDRTAQGAKAPESFRNGRVEVPETASVAESLEREIQSKNFNFSSMDKYQKRVAIARDVLDSLKSREYVASTGIYFNVCDMEESKSKISFQDAKSSGVVCQVCAIGSLFVSYLKKSNEDLERQYNNWLGAMMIRSMNDIFECSELRILESFFEYGESELGDKSALVYGIDESHRRQMMYGFTDHHRLTSIMQNLIDNEGHFVVFGKKYF